ncbi:unnamed protein product [Symbiodinium microadriaticum]|nr:unnamed protein product [Symbiodinium microadriaticum]
MSAGELEPGSASSALLPDPLAGPLRATQLFDEALRLIQGLRAEKTLAGSIGAVLLVKDRADADSLNLRIDEAYGTVDDAEAETNVEHACVAADIDGFVEQLEKMVQDILVVCVLPSADQEIQLELPCAAMERLQRCNVWFLSAQDAAVICTSDGPLRSNIQFEGMTCNLPSQAAVLLCLQGKSVLRATRAPKGLAAAVCQNRASWQAVLKHVLCMLASWPLHAKCNHLQLLLPGALGTRRAFDRISRSEVA